MHASDIRLYRLLVIQWYQTVRSVNVDGQSSRLRATTVSMNGVDSTPFNLYGDGIRFLAPIARQFGIQKKMSPLGDGAHQAYFGVFVAYDSEYEATKIPLSFEHGIHFVFGAYWSSPDPLAEVSRLWPDNLEPAAHDRAIAVTDRPAYIVTVD